MFIIEKIDSDIEFGQLVGYLAFVWVFLLYVMAVVEYHVWCVVLEWPNKTLECRNYDSHNLAEFLGVDVMQLPPITRRMRVESVTLKGVARPDELNVVEIFSLRNRRENDVIFSARLVGESAKCTPNIVFSHPPVTFHLVQGRGPVIIYGKYEYVKHADRGTFHGSDLLLDEGTPFIGF